jgi:Tripartite tricarboxylate transporter family receptor
MAFMPLCRMGPPPRSFAADAQDCIMVRVVAAHRIQGCGTIVRARQASSPRTPSPALGGTRHIQRQRKEVLKIEIHSRSVAPNEIRAPPATNYDGSVCAFAVKPRAFGGRNDRGFPHQTPWRCLLQYDLLKDLEPVALLVSNPELLVAKKALPANDLAGLIAWLKSNPDKAVQGHGGVGSIA